VTAGLLTLGAVTLNWICDKITEAGFGKSLLILEIIVVTWGSSRLSDMSVSGFSVTAIVFKHFVIQRLTL